MSDITFAPQPGFQTRCLESPADILICGGSSGPGKTWLLLYEFLRHKDVKGFNGTIFRRTYPQIESVGGLWDKSADMYQHFGGKPQKSAMEWNFDGVRMVFRHMQHAADWQNYQGSEMCYLAFDELTQFERNQFFKLMAWNRSTCGVKPYIRASCNPDPDSFVAELIDWYLDDGGYVDPDRDGKVRYFITIDDVPVWGDSKEEVYELARYKLDSIPIDNKFDLIKSFSFIKGDIYENKELLKADPSYIANLMAMTEEEQKRFLEGNWRVKVDGNVIINYDKFQNIWTNTFVSGGERYMTCDIATEGKDFLSIWVWEGNKVIHLELIDKNSGKEAYEIMDSLKNEYRVTNSNISFDASGVGGALTGWFEEAIEFKGIMKPIGSDLYTNIKSQCAYEFSYCVNQTHEKTEEDAYYIPPEIANMIFPYNKPNVYRGRTIKWILNQQLRALRKIKPDDDGKVGLITKKEMIGILHGTSPDLLESLSQKEVFNLKNATITGTRR